MIKIARSREELWKRRVRKMETGISQLPGNEAALILLDDVVHTSYLKEPCAGAPSVIRLELTPGAEYQEHWARTILEEARSLDISIDGITQRYGDDDCGGRRLIAIEISALGDNVAMDDLCASLSLDHEEYLEWSQAPLKDGIAIDWAKLRERHMDEKAARRSGGRTK